MYGHYPITINLDESIAEITRVLQAIKGPEYTRAMTTEACAHYKHLALVCACAFMMSPVALGLKDLTKRNRVRVVLGENVDSVYPIFAVQSQLWGYQETMAVVTELALSYLQTILFLIPKLEYVLGMPNMYTIIPIQVGQVEAPHIDAFAHLPEQVRNDVIARMDTETLVTRPIERKNMLSFTLWVRPPASLTLLT
jgi:hypothetical protein